MPGGRAFTRAALLLHRGGLRLGGLAAAYFGVSVLTSVYRNKQVLGMGGWICEFKWGGVGGCHISPLQQAVLWVSGWICEVKWGGVDECHISPLQQAGAVGEWVSGGGWGHSRRGLAHWCTMLAGGLCALRGCAAMSAGLFPCACAHAHEAWHMMISI